MFHPVKLKFTLVSKRNQFSLDVFLRVSLCLDYFWVEFRTKVGTFFRMFLKKMTKIEKRFKMMDLARTIYFKKYRSCQKDSFRQKIIKMLSNALQKQLVNEKSQNNITTIWWHHIYSTDFTIRLTNSNKTILTLTSFTTFTTTSLLQAQAFKLAKTKFFFLPHNKNPIPKFQFVLF